MISRRILEACTIAFVSIFLSGCGKEQEVVFVNYAPKSVLICVQDSTHCVATVEPGSVTLTELWDPPKAEILVVDATTRTVIAGPTQLGRKMKKTERGTFVVVLNATYRIDEDLITESKP